MEELIESCDFLDLALERYSNACAALEIQVYHNFAQADLHATFLKGLSDKLTRVLSHKVKVKRCERTLRRVRNHSASIVPVNGLPPEVLTRIFSMVHSCSFESPKSFRLAQPMYPDTLAQVCSRWRRIATGYPALWTHIDLSPLPNNNLGQRLLSRGKVFASRSNTHLLDVHIRGSGGDGDKLAKFCAVIAMRTRSLEVFCPSLNPDQLQDIYTPIFDNFMMHCVPGILNHLEILGEFGYGFRQSAGANDYIDGFVSVPGVDRKRLNELLLRTRVLRLGLNCIPSKSRVFQGLVELQLMGSGMRLTESQFLGMLAASPTLRILHLVDVDLWEGSYSPPKVQLNELETLYLSWAEYFPAPIRLLFPGPRPVKLILEARKRLPMSRATATSFINLLERSFVTELYVQHGMGTSGCGEILFNPFQLLDLTPQLRVLALSGMDMEQPSRRLVDKPSISSAVSSTSSLHTLHLIQSCIEWTSYRDLIRSHDIQRMTIWDCKLHDSKRASRTQSDQGIVKEILGDICPKVQLLGDGILKLARVHDESQGI